MFWLYIHFEMYIDAQPFPNSHFNVFKSITLHSTSLIVNLLMTVKNNHAILEKGGGEMIIKSQEKPLAENMFALSQNFY